MLLALVLERESLQVMVYLLDEMLSRQAEPPWEIWLTQLITVLLLVIKRALRVVALTLSLWVILPMLRRHALYLLDIKRDQNKKE